MNWTYRVTKEFDSDNNPIFSIRECYTKEGSKPPYKDSDYTSWTAESVAPIGSSVEDLRFELERMIKACDETVIEVTNHE